VSSIRPDRRDWVAPIAFPFAEGPRVRIRLPPAVSGQTIGASGADQIVARSWQPPFAGSSHSRRRAGFIPGPSSAGRASRTGPQSRRRAQQQRPIGDQQRPSALSDPAKAIPRQSRGSVKSPRPPSAHRFPARSFFGGFPTPAPYTGSIADGPASETLTGSSRSLALLSSYTLNRSGGRNAFWSSPNSLPYLAGRSGRPRQQSSQVTGGPMVRIRFPPAASLRTFGVLLIERLSHI
jgi:hypothetical protein